MSKDKILTTNPVYNEISLWLQETGHRHRGCRSLVFLDDGSHREVAGLRGRLAFKHCLCALVTNGRAAGEGNQAGILTAGWREYARFGFRVRGAVLKSEDLGHALAQVGRRRVVRMHPVLGTHCVAVLRVFHFSIFCPLGSAVDPWQRVGPQGITVS